MTSNYSRAIRQHWDHLLSYRSHGTLVSYTDHSMQRRLKSNAPIVLPMSHVRGGKSRGYVVLATLIPFSIRDAKERGLAGTMYSLLT